MEEIQANRVQLNQDLLRNAAEVARVKAEIADTGTPSGGKPVPGENRAQPASGFPGNISEDDPLLERLKEGEITLGEYYEEAGDDARKANGDKKNFLELLGIDKVHKGLVVFYNGECYKVIDKDLVNDGRPGSNYGTSEEDAKCNPPPGPGWKWCPCCDPDVTTSTSTTSTSTTSTSTTSTSTTSTSTTSTTSTTPPPTSTTPTTPCCTPECSPPAERLGMWFWDDPDNNYLRPFQGVAEVGMVFWEGPEFEGTKKEKEIAGAMLENDQFEFNQLLNAYGDNGGDRGALNERLAQWAAEYHDEDKRQCYKIYDEDAAAWVNNGNQETRPSKDITDNGVVDDPPSDTDDDLDDDGTADRGNGWQECECCPCCPPTICGLCWDWEDRDDNVFIELDMVEVDPAGNKTFKVEEGTVVAHCCKPPPIVNDGFVDKVIQDAFDRGVAAKQDVADAEENLAEAEEARDAVVAAGPRTNDRDDAEQVVRDAEASLWEAREALGRATLDYNVANGAMTRDPDRDLLGVPDSLARRIENQSVNEGNQPRTPVEMQNLRDTIDAEVRFQEANPGVGGDRIDPDLPLGEGRASRSPALRNALNDIPLVDVVDGGVIAPDEGGGIAIEPVEEIIEVALARQRLIERDENNTGIAEDNQLTRDDIEDGDDLRSFIPADGRPEFDPDEDLENVAKNFEKDCRQACRPICYKVIDPDFVNANPQLNPAIDVLSKVNDPAVNPQNEDKPAKFFTKDLEPGDKGTGWEMCECCPCPPDDLGKEPEKPEKPDGPDVEIEEKPVVIDGRPPTTTPVVTTTPEITTTPTFTTSTTPGFTTTPGVTTTPEPTTTPGVTTPPVVTTSTTPPPPVLTTTPVLTTPPLPTTVCPPNAKGGPRCNVLKF